MDCRCNWFGIAAAAKVPVKRYNVLFEDIYPVVEPSLHSPVSIGTDRKIAKLAEYLERNEGRAPKARPPADARLPVPRQPAHELPSAARRQSLKRGVRGPLQVSRRLSRRLHSDLRAGRLGYVALSVHTYIHLLRATRPEKMYLYAAELLLLPAVRECSVVQRSCGAGTEQLPPRGWGGKPPGGWDWLPARSPRPLSAASQCC